jgi:hypothetical protein
MAFKMSKISSIYNALVSETALLFPLKTRMHNPYELSDNPEIILKDSYGLKVNSATRETVEFCNLYIVREFTLVMVRNFLTNGTKGTAFDDVSKSLLEDQQAFLSMIYSPDELSEQINVDMIEIGTVSGIQFMTANEKKYLLCEITFTITISESVI